jgi:hypothetical protein
MVDAELRNRIAKLEKLVETFDGKRRESGDVKLEAVGSGSGAAEVPPASEEIVATSDGSSPVEKRGPSKTSRYVAASFWSSLTSEVKALADAFDEDESHSDDGTTPDSTPPSAADQVDPSNGTTPHYDLLLCPPGVVYIMPGAVPEPPPTVAVDLLSSFMIHVEPMYKLFHAPTLRKFLYHGEPYLNRSHDAPCNKALKACIYFAGATAFTDSECHKFGTSRKELVTEYRRAVDVALYQADPLNTTELATLQALVLYVVGHYHHQSAIESTEWLTRYTVVCTSFRFISTRLDVVGADRADRSGIRHTSRDPRGIHISRRAPLSPLV